MQPKNLSNIIDIYFDIFSLQVKLLDIHLLLRLRDESQECHTPRDRLDL